MGKIFAMEYGNNIKTAMNNREKLQKMDRALRLLEDLKNSQVALIEKSSQLQLDAMEFNFPNMEKNMAELYTKYNELLDILNEEIERFDIRRNKFEMEHGLDKEEGEEA